MLDLDYWAQNNRLKTVSIPEKAFLFLGGLIFALSLQKPLALLALAVLMHGIMIFQAGIPIRFLMKLWMAPAAFIGISLITVAISFSSDPSLFLFSIPLGPWRMGVTAAGLILAKTLLLRSIASLSCLFGLATTTPAAYGAAWAARSTFLRPITEIALLTYRFIFVVLESAGQIHKAQDARLSYCGFRRSLWSLSLLAASIGRKSFWSVRDIYLALISRNYQERLVYRYPDYPVSWQRISIISAVWMSLTVWSLWGATW